MNSFETSKRVLYQRLMLFVMVVSFGLSVYYYFIEAYQDFLPNVSFFVISVFSYFLFKSGRKKIAYHLTLIFTFAINVFFFFTTKSPLHSIVMMGTSLTIYTLVFFSAKTVQQFYLVLIIIIEFLMFHQSMNEDGLNFSNSFWSEYFTGVFHIAIVYLIGLYFMERLRASNNEIDVIKAEVFKQEQSLINQNIELQHYIESNKKLENFSYLASHELKSPLRIVKSFADLVYKTRNKLSEEKIDEYLEMVSSNSEKMTHLVDALQDMGSITQKKLEKANIRMSTLIQSILYERKDEAINANIELKIESENLFGDERMIHRLFSNLLGNALKFTSPNVLPSIQIHCYEDTQYFHFQICDNGIGIKENRREEVFELFNRQNTYSQYEGLGIGLALSKQIVDLHAGTIGISESESGGTCFNIRLPIH